MLHTTMMRLNLNYHDQEVLSGHARNLALQCVSKVSSPKNHAFLASKLLNY